MVIVGANQMPLLYVPAIRRDHLDPNNTGLTRIRRAQPRMNPTALWGRSIFWAIRDAVPQFNEFMALLSQVIRVGALGTWMMTSLDGSPRPFDIGSGIMNYGEMGVEVKRYEPGQPPEGLAEILRMIYQELQMGSVPADLMTAASQATSGFDRAQIISVALNSVGSYMIAHNAWAEQVTQQFLSQFQGKSYEMLARGYDPTKTPFELTIRGDEIDRYYDVKIKRQLALPDDTQARIQMARLALDPAAPILDPWTVLDEIMEVEDPDLVIDKLWEYKVWFFPPIQFNLMKEALIRRGDFTPDQMNMILTMEAASQYQAETMKLQGQGTVAQMQSSMPGTGMSPSTLPPEAAGAMGGQAPPTILGPNGQPLTR